MVGTWTFALKLTCTLKNPRDMWVPHSPTLLYAFFFFLFFQLLYTHEHQSLFPVLRWFPLSSPVACGTHVWGVVSVILHLLYSTLVCSRDLMSFYALSYILLSDWLIDVISKLLSFGFRMFYVCVTRHSIYIYSVYKIVFRHLHADPLDMPILLTTPPPFFFN